MAKRLIQSIHQIFVFAVLCIPLLSGAAGNAIVIGQTLDLSGPNAEIGRDYAAGIKTCFDMVNARGGINGKAIQYLVRDDAGQAANAARATTELIEREQVDYLFGGVGDETMQATLETAAFKRSDLILFAPLIGADKPDQARVLFWRPGYKDEIRHIFSHFGKLGMKSVGIAYQETPGNRDAYRSLADEVRIQGIKLTATARIGKHAGTVNDEARQLAGSRPGFVIVIGDTISSSLFLKEFRKYDSQTFIAGTSLINLATLRELAGAKAVEWTVFSQVVPDPASGASALQIEHLNMMKKYRDESASALTLEGFAAAKTLVKAIQLAKRSDRMALQEWSTQTTRIDLGGLSVTKLKGNPHLSSYLDIALFKKGGGLKF